MARIGDICKIYRDDTVESESRVLRVFSPGNIVIPVAVLHSGLTYMYMTAGNRRSRGGPEGEDTQRVQGRF